MNEQDKNRIVGTPISSQRFKVNFKSTECLLEIGEGVDVDDLEINFYNKAQSVRIGSGCKLRGVIHLVNWDNHVVIGAGTRCLNMLWMSVTENSCRIDIGENCLFANVKFRTSDSHKIYDMETNERLNPGKSIRVGDRVWIAEDVNVYKGVEISHDSIVAARSLVVTSMPPHALIGGVPAKVIRTGVRWEE